MLRVTSRVGRLVRPTRGLCEANKRFKLHVNDMWLNPMNASYLESLAEDGQAPPDLQEAFERASKSGSEEPVMRTLMRPPSMPISGIGQYLAGVSSGDGGGAAHPKGHIYNKLSSLVRAYRKLGHLSADVDPIGLHDVSPLPELDPAHWGFTSEELASPIPSNYGSEQAVGFSASGALRGITIAALIANLQRTYCGRMGIEYSHIANPEERAFIINAVEVIDPAVTAATQGGPDPSLSTSVLAPPEAVRKLALEDCIRAVEFENALKRMSRTAKRFGGEGCDSFIALMNAIVDRSSEAGVQHFPMCAAHRGRLALLSLVLGKPLTRILTEFLPPPNMIHHTSGDVKYHNGWSITRANRVTGKTESLSLLPNPSHLEAVNPICMGKARSIMDGLEDEEGAKVLPVQVHGDAAYAGQGIIYEVAALGQVEGYTNHGTIHVVINNQVGFTANPKESRNSHYCTGIALATKSPVFHVNANSPDDVVRAARLAVDFRMRFQKDVVIDLIGYRKHGHNEGDEPRYTQPRMYAAIDRLLKEQGDVSDIYTRQLVKEKVYDEPAIKNVRSGIREQYDAALEKATDKNPSSLCSELEWMGGAWQGFAGFAMGRIEPTKVTQEAMEAVTKIISAEPEGFTVHRTVQRALAEREQALAEDSIPFNIAELLAFGTLLLEGTNVRLSGQDSERGTFTHRHSVVHCQKTYKSFNHLANMKQVVPGSGAYTVLNSPLSEYGVLGFELGYSYNAPRPLVLWEAQFGDFANGAQIILDQFLAAGEAKWLRQSGLVVLLPHGFDGQGPEHSSARLERFLQLSDDPEDPGAQTVGPVIKTKSKEASLEQTRNIQIVVPTTAANYFHALRRQVKRTFRKPLIVFFSKRHLRSLHSPVKEFTEGGFRRVIGDDVADPSKVERHVLCSGKDALDEIKKRQKAGEIEEPFTKVAFTRLEQIAPFPAEEVQAELERYPNAEVIWLQEEPRNNGAWSFVDRRIERVMRLVGSKQHEVHCVARRETGAVATGYADVSAYEQAVLLSTAMGLEPPKEGAHVEMPDHDDQLIPGA